MRRFAAIATLLLPGALSAQNAGVEAAAASITEEDFYRRVGVIADDSMMGRDTPSPGLDMTARWIADEFRRLGLKPGGDEGSFLQLYAIQQIVPDLENSVVRASVGPDLLFGEDVISAFGTPSGEDVSGGMSILAGNSLPDGFQGDQIRGRHLIIVPPVDAEAGRRAQMQLLMGVMGAGPASVMLVSRQTDEEWNRAAELQGQQVQSRVAGQGGPRGFPTILAVREGSLRRVLEAVSADLPEPPTDPSSPGFLRTVPGLELTVSARTRILQEVFAPNTVGILEGSDPALKDEYLVFSAHMDHTGVGRPGPDGDSIYNGADDDASGTVAVVELAEAFAMMDPAPKRSMIFLAVSGEEHGLWGSAYYAKNPSVSAESMVANLNADMIARNWPDSIVVIGKEHSDLGETLERVAEAHPELDMVPMDDIWPEEGFYSRSDHINFARKGVPILFFFNGPHEDYHQPSDDLAKIDAEKAARITRLMFYLGLEVANAPERPQWVPEHYAEIVGGGGR